MGRKVLVRETKKTALTRMEDAARTVGDFKDVVVQWNRLDRNSARRVRYNEVKRPNAIMLHWDRMDERDSRGSLKPVLNKVIPRPIEFQWWQQVMSGDFIDTIHDCPYELGEMVEDAAFSQILDSLTENQKEILYYSVIRQYNNMHIAYIRSQTDRNIRKTLALLMKRLREKLVAQIRQREQDKLLLSPIQLEFLAAYDETDIDTDDDE